MKNFFFVTISLNNVAGGLEKNLVNICNYLSNHGYKINIITFDLNKSTPFYRIDKKIDWYKLGLSEPHQKYSLINKIKLLINLRKVFKKNQNKTKVICFHHGILPRIILSTIGLKHVEIICSERNSLSIYKYVNKKKFNFGFLLLYLVKKITVQFEEYKKNYPKILKKKIITIHNIIDDISFKQKGKNKVILNIGRLSTQKNQTALIKIFEEIADQCEGWSLKIIGDGENEKIIKKTISNSKFKSRILLLKPTLQMEDVYNGASIFCLTSQWEGFPNALAEALSCGIPAICFKNCDGANVLIKNKFNGFQVNNNKEFAEKLLFLIKNKSALEEYSKNSKKIKDIYNKEKIMNNWIKLLDGK